jgi:hypothetical protein
LFPIVRLLAPRTEGEWRGTLTPADKDAWFRSYTDWMGTFASLAQMTGAEKLVIGSELSSLDGDVRPWKQLMERVRALFAGTTIYSANWDHYKDAAVLDLVDEPGVTAYFRLRPPGSKLTLAPLVSRWETLREELEAWAKGRQEPFLFTEIGYRSRSDATVSPWDESPGGTPDMEEQVLGFEAFRSAWRSSQWLRGIYIWNWYGFGGPGTTGYTPRGKAAVDAVKALLDALGAP